MQVEKIVNVMSSSLLIFVMCFLTSELLVRNFLSDPDAEAPLAACTKEAQSPYEGDNQCYSSQEEIAKMQYDTFVGYIPAANESGTGWKTNNDHFRYDDNFSMEKPKNEYRIFITGGSSAWGAGVSQEQTFAHLLEKRLNSKNPKRKYRVVIAAAGAWASSQEKVFIFNYVVKFKPDIIMMFSGWNDIYYGYTGKYFNIKQDFLHYEKAIALYCEKSEGIQKEKLDSFDAISPPKYREFQFKTWYLINKALYTYKIKSGTIAKSIRENQLPSEKIGKNILENIELINYLSKKNGFLLIYFFQPSLYSSQKHLSQWEIGLHAESLKKYLGFFACNIKNYKFLKTLIYKDSLEKNIYLLMVMKLLKMKETVFLQIMYILGIEEIVSLPIIFIKFLKIFQEFFSLKHLKLTIFSTWEK